MSVGHVIGYENGHKDVGQAAGYENGQGLQSMNIGNHRQPNRYSISNDFLNSFEQLKIGTENKVDKVNEKTDAAENALNIHPYFQMLFIFLIYFFIYFFYFRHPQREENSSKNNGRCPRNTTSCAKQTICHDMTGLSNVHTYAARQYATTFMNNIKLHAWSRVRKFFRRKHPKIDYRAIYQTMKYMCKTNANTDQTSRYWIHSKNCSAMTVIFRD